MVRAMWKFLCDSSFSRCLLLVAALSVSLFLFNMQLSVPMFPLLVGLLPQNAPSDHPRRGEQNIMFVETSCALKDVPWSGLSPRQSCAIESAVRHNPSWRVYLLHTCAEPDLQVPTGTRAVYTPLAAMLRNTTLYAPLLEAGALAHSKWPVAHSADVMRLIALWKYGGIYLDLDVVVLRPLSNLGWNWAGAQSSKVVDNAAFSISTSANSSGQQVVEEALQSLKDDFRGDQWSYNGPLLITRLLMYRCNASNTTEMSNCRGFRVWPPELLYPVPWESWRRLLTPSDTNRTLLLTRDAYIVHIWNKMSHLEQVVHPKSAYASIAKENCPHSYSAANGKF